VDELQDKIVALVDGAGGSMPYPALLAQMDSFEYRILKPALDNLKASNRARQIVAWDKETSVVSHTVTTAPEVKADGDRV
jgi:hypothetical protein